MAAHHRPDGTGTAVEVGGIFSTSGSGDVTLGNHRRTSGLTGGTNTPVLVSPVFGGGGGGIKGTPGTHLGAPGDTLI